jgi:hypothetical protein
MGGSGTTTFGAVGEGLLRVQPDQNESAGSSSGQSAARKRRVNRSTSAFILAHFAAALAQRRRGR